MDEDIFVFQGPEWVMKISIEFFIWRSLVRCRAVMKNAFRHYDLNESELYRLCDFMDREVSMMEKEEKFQKIKDKFEKLITYYNQEVEKHGD